MNINQRFMKSEEHYEIFNRKKNVLSDLYFHEFNKTRYSENPSYNKILNA